MTRDRRAAATYATTGADFDLLQVSSRGEDGLQGAGRRLGRPTGAQVTEVTTCRLWYDFPATCTVESGLIRLTE